MKKIGLDIKKVQAKRIKLGLTYKEVGERMGGQTSENARQICNKENITLKTLEKLAYALREKPKDLLR